MWYSVDVQYNTSDVGAVHCQSPGKKTVLTCKKKNTVQGEVSKKYKKFDNGGKLSHTHSSCHGGIFRPPDLAKKQDV